MTAKQNNVDPDAQLSDHEWRLKQAAEGKALYIPGKSVEQMKAQMAAEAAQGQSLIPVAFEMAEVEFRALDTAIPDAMDLISDAGFAFATLADNTLGNVDPGLSALMRLAARALKNAVDREVLALDRLDRKLREVSGQRARAALDDKQKRGKA